VIAPRTFTSLYNAGQGLEYGGAMPCFTLERSRYLIFEAASFVSHVVNVYD
jgi:hypothetical protein